jgi:putative Holliday junction resolvase
MSNCQEIKTNNSQISHILGIDYGTAKVGLALADMETKIAFVYDTLKNDKNFLDNLVKITQKEKISTIIIGIPNYNNSEEGSYEGNKLGELIKKTLPEIEVEYQDEMFSTKMAQNNLIEKGMKNVGKIDDAESAKIILQSWLDRS